MSDAGHNYTFGAPRGGWPSFGPDGRRTREDAGGHGKMRPDDAREAAEEGRSAPAVGDESSPPEIGAPRGAGAELCVHEPHYISKGSTTAVECTRCPAYAVSFDGSWPKLPPWMVGGDAVG